MSFDLNEDQQDCLQELINVAMGQASDQLARYLDTFVFLSVPSIDLVSAQELSVSLETNEESMAKVSQGFFGYEGIRGEAILIYEHKDSDKIGDMLGYEPDELSIEEQLIDISSILTTTFLNVFASQIENQMSYSAPKLLADMQGAMSEHLKQLSFSWDTALKVNIAYQVTDYSFNCDMILLIPEAAIVDIKKVIDRILEDY